MKKTTALALILVLLAALISCSASGKTIDFSKGKDSPCFASLRNDPETLSIEVVQKGEAKEFTFEGVYLKDLLEKEGIKSFSKIEAVASDLDEPVDITDFAKSEAGVFLAWSESGAAETPMRVLPADAQTANLLTRNVTGLIITK